MNKEKQYRGTKWGLLTLATHTTRIALWKQETDILHDKTNKDRDRWQAEIQQSATVTNQHNLYPRVMYHSYGKSPCLVGELHHFYHHLYHLYINSMPISGTFSEKRYHNSTHIAHTHTYIYSYIVIYIYIVLVSRAVHRIHPMQIPHLERWYRRSHLSGSHWTASSRSSNKKRYSTKK